MTAPYVLQVPLARDLWVRLEATRPLGERHWDRLGQILALQRDIGGDPVFAQLIEADIGVPSAIATVTEGRDRNGFGERSE